MALTVHTQLTATWVQIATGLGQWSFHAERPVRWAVTTNGAAPVLPVRGHPLGAKQTLPIALNAGESLYVIGIEGSGLESTKAGV